MKKTLDNIVFIAVLLALAFLVVLTFHHKARAHEHKAGETSEAARVVDFYSTWHRPKGDFEIKHREPMCCWAAGDNQDCFPVLARRINEKGQEELTPDVSEAPTAAQLQYGGKWWPNIYHITEDEQIDPRESPDGRSHMCVTGEAIVCYVRGWGN